MIAITAEWRRRQASPESVDHDPQCVGNRLYGSRSHVCIQMNPSTTRKPKGPYDRETVYPAELVKEPKIESRPTSSTPYPS